MRMSDYPNESPRAVARLLALAVAVDGVPADAEIELLGEIFCADHRLAQGESTLLREALAYWGETAFLPEQLGGHRRLRAQPVEARL